MATMRHDPAVEAARARRLAQSGEARRIRERAGASRSDIARSCKVADSTIGRWEAGTRRPRADTARRYARVLRQLEAMVEAVSA